ncbi:MAG: hypothetical protein K8J09_21960 [Planctomycetes bacterium]|nr:hypothetical protein [Planctomycetota bacterium]MCC7398609.1 hypothetical protein [Planctomycetota bacterium]
MFAQVFFAIGAGLLLMVPLRRVPIPGRLALGLALLVVVEWANLPGREMPLGAMLLVRSGFWPSNGQGLDVLVLYPALA